MRKISTYRMSFWYIRKNGDFYVKEHKTLFNLLFNKQNHFHKVYIILQEHIFFKNVNFFSVPESYSNSKILNRQSLSKSTFNTIAKIFCILWTVIPGILFSIECLPACQQQKSIPSPQYGAVPPGPQSSTWGWLISLDC